MKRITRRLEFDAGHRVVGHETKCKNVHGHRYVAEITVEAQELDHIGRVIDFGAVKELVGGWIDRYWDHGYIANPDDVILEDIERGGWKVYRMPAGQNPTAECMVEELAKRARELLDLSMVGLTVCHVRLYETPNCWADWRPS